MFDGFEQVKDANASKRWFASTGTSLLVVMVICGGLVLLARQQVGRVFAAQEIDVTFRATPEPVETKKEAPPPPPPPTLKVNKARRPGRPALAQPTAIPEDRPAETTPAGNELQEAVDEFGDGASPTAPPPPVAPPPAPEPSRIVEAAPPIDEVDTSFVAARPLTSNTVPAYPEDARRRGAESEVRLKVRIAEDGRVVDVMLLAGVEPFVSVAIAAVKTWRYQPATDNGRPVASTRVIAVPFRLQSR